MKKIICIIAGCILVYHYTCAQTTYYSSNTGNGGDWDLASSWTLSSDGSGAAAGPPTRTDDIVILNGHTITVDAADDNGSAGTSASTEYTVGAFTGNGANRFYQNGLIRINSGGVLSITDNNGAMLEDTIYVFGTLQVTAGGNNDDLINAGYMHVYSSSTLSVGDDLILIANSETILDDTALSSDDIYLDGTSALICGSGSLDIGGAIQEFNGADANNQVCSTFTINCSDGDCCDDGTTVASCAGNGDDGSFGGGGSFVLPVELIVFDGVREQGNVILNWKTATEINNSHFTISKSLDGKDFNVKGIVKGNGTTSEISEYQFIDQEIHEQANFYRLAQTDFDGSFEILSTVYVPVQLPSFGKAVFYPNPATDSVEPMIGWNFISKYQITDFAGRTISSKVSPDGLIDLSKLSAGIYFLKWTGTDLETRTEKLIIRK